MSSKTTVNSDLLWRNEMEDDMVAYERDGLVRRDGVEMLTEVPEGWEVKILQLPHTSPFAVAAHPGHPTRIALLRNLPLPFEDWLVLTDRVEGD